jgi:transcriptional regulator with XRE-family HTH domain
MSTKAPNPVDKYVGSRVRMRRIMLGMSQEKLGEALGLTFQQVQKYEKGTNRVGASRIQQISEILRVPVSFLFEGGPSGIATADGYGEGSSPAYVSDFLATSEGLALTRAFTRITDAKLRRSIVEVVEQIAAREGTDKRENSPPFRGATEGSEPGIRNHDGGYGFRACTFGASRNDKFI